MKPAIFATALLVSHLHADLVITEVMADSSRTLLKGDWWELTNTGAAAVDLAGYKWDDTPEVPLTVSTFPSVVIQPGESIIILGENLADAPAWKSAWGLTSTQVVAKDQMNIGVVGPPTPEAFSGLSGPNGDELNLYDASGTLVAHADFGTSVTGRSQAFLRNGRAIHGLHSVSGKHGAWIATDTGSPGDARIHFTSAPVAHATSGYTHEITAEDPGSPAPVISATSLPSFLTMTPGAAGTAVISNNRPLGLADAGDYLIQVTATGASTSTIQEYILTVLNPSPTVILNEYNAVSQINYLNGGTAFADEDGGDASADTHFGRVAWNGGKWVEFVVVGNGGAGLVDLRGWRIEIGKNLGSGFATQNTLVLSNHANWQSVPSGTILTFIDRNTAQGGLDSGFAIRNQRGTLGDTWTNIWMGDPTHLVYTSLATNGFSLSAGVVSGINIDNNVTQFRVKNPAGQIVFGPAGEGVGSAGGTSSKEIFELEGEPNPQVSPIAISTPSTQGYDDGASDSTFGSPNNWLDGINPVSQDFSPYIADGFVLWAESHGLAGSLALRTADPDLDGQSNFNEYAFGGDPDLKDAPYPAGPLTAGPVVGWSYVRRSNDPALTFGHESSENLALWTTLAATSTISVPYAPDPAFSTVTVQFNRPIPTPVKWFVRSKAE